MSSERVELLSREDVVQRLRERLVELEEEIRLIKSILALLGEERRPPRPDERVEEIRQGKKKIGVLYIGKDYVRMVPEGEAIVTEDLRVYLESLVEELRLRQKRMGIISDDEEGISLEIKTGPGGELYEIVVSGIRDTREFVKVHAALRYTATVLYEIASRRAGAR